MLGDQRIDKIESQSQPFGVDVLSIARAKEAIRELCLLFGRYADPLIFDADFKQTLICAAQ